MKEVVAISCVRNEADIIEAFVRHTLTHVDKLLIIDNASTDQTVSILRSLQAEGLPLVLKHDDGLGHYHSRRMNLLLDEAVTQPQVAWVVPLDADEFIMGEQPLRDRLLAEPEVVLQWRWRMFVPTPQDNPAETNPVLRIRHRVSNYPIDWFKVLVPSSLARRGNTMIEQGNHAVIVDGQRQAAQTLTNLELAHFPVRTAAQYASKSIIGYLQYKVQPDWERSFGFHRIDPYERSLASYTAFEREISRIASIFALTAEQAATFLEDLREDPLPYRGGPLRYYTTTPGLDHLITSLAKYADRLAAETVAAHLAEKRGGFTA
ncbi:MAG: glycosyltransferase family 2 protein [Gammaproteobacteria bacterium]